MQVHSALRLRNVLPVLCSAVRSSRISAWTARAAWPAWQGNEHCSAFLSHLHVDSPGSPGSLGSLAGQRADASPKDGGRPAGH
jgi:hypothetical protein